MLRFSIFRGMYKLFILFVLLNLVLIISSTAVRAENKELTLSKSINLALKNDLNLKLAKVNLDSSRINYSKNKASNLLAKSRYKRLNNELKLAEAKEDYRQTKNELIISVVDNYLSLIEKEVDIKAKAKAAEYERQELKSIKIEVSRGERGYVDFLEQQTEYNTAIFDLKQAKSEYYLLLKDIELQLGLDLEDRVKLTGINKPKLVELTEKKALKKAVRNSMTLNLRKEYIELAEFALQKTKVLDAPKLNLKESKINKEMAELNYKKAAENLKNRVKKKYHMLKQAIGILDLRKQQLNQVKENYDIVKKQQKAGLKTKNELLLAENNFLNAKYNYQAAVTNYYLKQLQLQKVMGLEIEVLFDELL